MSAHYALCSLFDVSGALSRFTCRRVFCARGSPGRTHAHQLDALWHAVRFRGYACVANGLRAGWGEARRRYALKFGGDLQFTDVLLPRALGRHHDGWRFCYSRVDDTTWGGWHLQPRSELDAHAPLAMVSHSRIGSCHILSAGADPLRHHCLRRHMTSAQRRRGSGSSRAHDDAHASMNSLY